MSRRVDLIGVQMDSGATRRGCGMGPLAIRIAGVCEGLAELGYEVKDNGDIIPLQGGATLHNLKNYESVCDACKRLYVSVMKSLEDGAFPITIGGDHSISAGSISATSKLYKKIGVIWVDAHGDWNDENTTTSGNMHGMSFSAVCGKGPDIMADYGQEPVFLDIRRCVQIGGRDIDKKEAAKMKAAGLNVFPIDAIDRYGIREVMRRAVEIASDGTEGIHLSFDIDAVTPESAPGTGTAVHSGLTVREAFFCAETLYSSGKLLALDMVEVNPVLDIANATAKLASELILSAMGKVVY